MRIQPLEPPFTDDVAPLLERMMPTGMAPIALFRTFAHNPAMTNGINGWGSYYLSKQSSLDLRTRELVIDRTTARCGCEYEWGIHIALFADRVLLTSEQIHSITFGNSNDPCWIAARDRLTIELVDDLHDQASIGADLWERLAAEFATAQLLDMMLLTGWYHAISYVARSVELDPEPFATRFTDIG